MNQPPTGQQPPPQPWGHQPPRQVPWPPGPQPQPRHGGDWPNPVATPGPPGQWTPPPPPHQSPTWQPPSPSRKTKWPWKLILGATLLVVATVTATVLWDRHSASSNNPPASPVRSDVASANDTGPVAVITEDPTCAPWYPVNNLVADTEKNAGWDNRDASTPVSAWTPETRTMYTQTSDAMKSAVEQTIPLIKLTPHRAMRELYEQYVAYTRLVIDRIPNYAPKDDHVIRTSATISLMITAICNSIGYGAAAARGPVTPAFDAPKTTAPVGDPNKPEQYMTTADPICGASITANTNMENDPAWAPWMAIPSDRVASSWSPQDKAANEAIKPVLNHYTDTMADLARKDTNPVASDFAALAVVYGRAFTQGLMSYTTADSYLFVALRRAGGILSSACSVAS